MSAGRLSAPTHTESKPWEQRALPTEPPAEARKDTGGSQRDAGPAAASLLALDSVKAADRAAAHPSSQR